MYTCMCVETSGRSLYLRLHTRKSAKPTGRIIRASAHICKLVVIVTDPLSPLTPPALFSASLLPSPRSPGGEEGKGISSSLARRSEGDEGAVGKRGRVVSRSQPRDAKAREFLYSLYVYIYNLRESRTRASYTVRTCATIDFSGSPRDETIMSHARSLASPARVM